jgi:hypothetical protein
VTNQWQLELKHDKHIQSPTWNQISEAIAQVDGDAFSELSLHLIGQGALLVGGGNKVGNERRYIVNYLPENIDTPSLTLTDLSLVGTDVELTVQVTAEFPSIHCVRLPLALKAFRHFFETGELPNDLIWENDW